MSSGGLAPVGRTALLLRAAHLYHGDGLGQPEIARRLGLSQSGVSRLLRDAAQAGIVRTIVVTPPGTHLDLESGLRERFGLRDAVVADTPSDDESARLSAIGASAADYLSSVLRPGERIGVSSRSAALLAMAEVLQPLPKAHSVVQVLGAIGSATLRAQSTRLTDRIAQMASAEPVYLPAPGVVSSAAVRNGLLTDRHIADALTASTSITTLLTGIGARTAETRPSWGSALPDSDLERLAASDAVGDVCLNFFDRDGALLEVGISDHVLGIDAETLRKVPRRIGVAGGPSKYAAIRAAALGGWIDVLVTDNLTARALLDDES